MGLLGVTLLLSKPFFSVCLLFLYIPQKIFQTSMPAGPTYSVPELPRYHPHYSGIDGETFPIASSLSPILESCKYISVADLNNTRNDQNNLFLLHINIRSLPKNFDSLQRLVQNLNPKPQFVLLTELWLPPDTSEQYDLDNYVFEYSAPSQFRGKGAGLYIDSSIPYKRRPDLETHTIQQQSVFIEISKLTPFHLVVGCCYRSPSFPSSLFIDYIESTLETLNRNKKTCILGGDFNLDILKHETYEPSSIFTQSLSSLGYFPCISIPTRVTTCSKTLIDNFFTNDVSLIRSSSVLTSDISDHLPIILSLQSTTKPPTSKPSSNFSFDFRKIDTLKVNLTNKLANIFDIHDPVMATSLIHSTLAEEIKKLSITKLGRRHMPKQPWISFSLLQSINKKNDLYHKYIKTGKREDEVIYKTYRNILVSSIRTAKKLYYQRKLEENQSNPRKLFGTLLDLTHKSKRSKDLPEQFEINDKLVSDQYQIANHFNDFFATIGSSLNDALPPSTSDPLQFVEPYRGRPFEFHPVNNETICSVILSLKSTGSGTDGISSKILKLICPNISPHLTHVFNLCLLSGTFPNQFKDALVVPIHKNGNPLSPNNYRPISLLPSLSKVLEKLVYGQVIEFLTENNIIFDHQFGFRKNHSTFMPIALLYEEITSALACKKICASIYLDFRKAFDTVNHGILIQKLKMYGIQNVPLKFFESYLCNRSQNVKFNSYKSTIPKSITMGVPQGSVLGPLLFLLYINDIHKSSTIPSFYLFADDTALLFTSDSLDSLQRNIDHSITSICKWLNCNRLTLNASKSTFQLFSHDKNLDLQVKIGDAPLERKFSTKYLGILIDEDLRWKTQIKSLENSISRTIGIIQRNRYILNSCHIHLLYNSLILPFLTYCIQLWGSTYDYKLRKLVTLQKRIVRVIDGADRLAHTNPIFKKYGILKLHHLVEFTQLKLMHKFLCNQLPRPLGSRLYRIEFDPNQRNARQMQHFRVPSVRTMYRKFSLFVSAPRIWNRTVATKIRNIDDVPLSKTFFKLVVKKLYIDDY